MDQQTERLSRTVWIGVGLIILLLCGAYVLTRLQPHHPPVAALPVLGDIADFSLTNQHNQHVTLANLRGKVWLADIIFSRCPGPCARMTRQMASVQSALPTDSQAQLVSLTTDPDYDSPEILKAYPARLKLEATARWQFLTGTKKEIGELAAKSLKLAAVEKAAELRENPDDLFIHATIFVLVDKQARLRGIFETGGDGIEWTNVQPAILSAIKQLETRTMTFTDLPALNACLNGLSTVLLAAGFIFIKRGNMIAHRNCMISALVTSSVFLVCYLTYHYKMKQVYGDAHTKFLDPAWFRPIYLSILFTHLIGAFAIVPLVLITTTRAFKQRFEAHKKIARWTWPIWMYVSVTGVLIYFLLYQIFPQPK